MPNRRPEGVTRRKVERLLARGLRQADIAAKLGITRQAVHQQVRRLRDEGKAA